MCMTWSSQIPGKGAFVVTDTRMMYADGTHDDPGGKVVSVGSGWATGAGRVDAFELSARALRDAGPNVATRAKAIVDEALDTAGLTDCPKNHMLVIEPDTPFVVVLWKGEAFEWAYAGDGPADLTDEWPAIGNTLAQSLRAVGDDLAMRIRVVAACFWSTSQRSKDMSDVLEVGYILPTPDGPVRGFLRGKARDIAICPSDIFERFQAEPLGMLPREVVMRDVPAVANANGQIVSPALGDQGSILPTAVDKSLFSYNAGGPSTGNMWLAWSWPAFLIYKPDNTTISVPASSSLATPPTPTLSQVAGGALAARTRFVVIGYMKNGLVYRTGAEASFAISLNNLLKVTSPASVAGYDGWVPLVGATTLTEFFQTSSPGAPSSPVPFGTNWTEPSAGANLTGTPYNNAQMPNAVTATSLAASTSYYYYPWWDIVAALVAFSDPALTAPNAASVQKQILDGHVALTLTALIGVTPAGATTGSGTPPGGKFV